MAELDLDEKVDASERFEELYVRVVKAENRARVAEERLPEVQRQCEVKLRRMERHLSDSNRARRAAQRMLAKEKLAHIRTKEELRRLRGAPIKTIGLTEMEKQ